MKYTLVLSLLLFFNCKTHSKLPDPLEAGWKGKTVCKISHVDSKIRVLKCTFPPNVGHERHYHKPHFGYTLKGSTFQIKDDKGLRELHVKTGSEFSKDKISVHEVLNVGDSTAIFLIVEIK